MIKIKIPENLAEKLKPHVVTQRNVFVGGVLRETKDDLLGMVTVSFPLVSDFYHTFITQVI